MTRVSGALGALLLLLLVGCGGGTGSAVAPGALVVQSPVLTGATEIRVRGFDARGYRVFGPVSAVALPEVLVEAPGTVVEVRLEYRAGDRVVGLFQAPVNLAGRRDILRDVTPKAVPGSLARLQVEPYAPRHPRGLRLPARALAVFDDGTAQDVTEVVAWSASERAAVDAEGRVHGLAAGEVLLAAELAGVRGEARFSVVDAAPEALRLDPPHGEAPTGLPVPFRAIARLSDGMSLDVSPAVEWPERAPHGVATAPSRVRATLGPLSAEAALDETDATLTGIGVLSGGGHLPAPARQQASAWGYYSDGTSHDLTALVAWTSTDEAVARVSGSGAVSALAEGAVELRASFLQRAASAPITVEAATLQSLRLDPPHLDLPVGVSRSFRALGVYSDGTVRDLTAEAVWSSWNPAAVSVGTDGVAHANAAGTATLAAQVGAVSGTAPVGASSSTLSSLSITPADALLVPGHGLHLQAWGRFSDGSVHEVTRDASWSSSQPAVAAIGAMGAVSALTVGSTQAGASALGQQAVGSVTVSGARLVALHLGPRTLRTPVGTRLQLRAVAEYLDGAYRDITDSVDWTSQDPARVVVAPGGRASAVGAGIATVTATDPATGMSVQGEVEAAGVSLVRLDVTPQSPTGWPQQEFQAFAVGEFTDGTRVDLTDQALWSLTDPAVALVQEGRVLCLAQGSTAVQASVADLGANASTAVQVGAGPPEMVAVTLDSLEASVVVPSGDGSVVAFFANDDFGGNPRTGLYDRLTGTTTRLFEGADKPVYVREMSRSGRYLLLATEWAGLAPGDPDDKPDLFVHDRLLGTTRRVSVNSEGEETWDWIEGGSMSEDGRFVGIMAQGALFPGDTNDGLDVYLHDMETGLTRWVSRGWDGQPSEGNLYSYPPSLSEDGRYVAYDSNATNLVPGDTNSSSDIFVFDVQAGRNRLVSRTSAGAPANGDSTLPSISGDGSLVAWESFATNLIPGVTAQQVYVQDLRTGVLRLGSADTDGTLPNGNSFTASLSRDGRTLAFSSGATNLLSAKNTVFVEAYVKDLATGDLRWGSPRVDRTRLLAKANSARLARCGSLLTFSSDGSGFVAGDVAGTSRALLYDLGSPARMPLPSPRVPLRANVSTAGSLGNSSVDVNGFSASGDGNLVAFASAATNLVADDTNGVTDLFLRDVSAGTLVRPLPVQPDQGCYSPVLTPDGRYLLFRSTATNLVAGTTAGRSHVFLLDRQGGTLELISRTDAGVEADASSDSATLSDDGRFVAFRTSAANLAPGGAGLLVRDRQASAFTRPNLPANVVRPRISGGGGTVVFDSSDPTILGDPNNQQDTFALDLGTGAVERVNVSTAGTPGNAYSHTPEVSSDGRFVVFGSSASNLVAGDTNTFVDVFVRDRLLGTTVRVNLGEAGNQGNNNAQAWTVSGDGRWVAFSTAATHVLYQGFSGLAVVDLVTREVRDGGRSGETTAAWGPWEGPVLADDGRHLFSRSRTTTLIPGRSSPNSIEDLFRALSPFQGGL